MIKLKLNCNLNKRIEEIVLIMEFRWLAASLHFEERCLQTEKKTSCAWKIIILKLKKEFTITTIK